MSETTAKIRTAAGLVLLFVVGVSHAGFWIATNPQALHSKRPDAILYERIAENLAAGNGYSADLVAPYRAEIKNGDLSAIRHFMT